MSEGSLATVYNTCAGRFGGQPLLIVYAMEDDEVMSAAYPVKRAYHASARVPVHNLFTSEPAE
jgi:hypothetical protein